MRTFPAIRQAAGFTLLELLIGLFLLGLMMTVLFSGLRLGAGSWEAAERKLSETSQRETALRVLERQFTLAVPVHYQDERLGRRFIAFSGHPDHVVWVAPLPAHRGGGGLHQLRLEVADTEAGSGLVLHYRLFDPESFVNTEMTESVLLMEAVSGLQVSYFGQYPGQDRSDWHERWEHDQILPLMVALRLDTTVEQMSLVVAPRQFLAPSATLDFGPVR